jgi:hypothetical protein
MIAGVCDSDDYLAYCPFAPGIHSKCIFFPKNHAADSSMNGNPTSFARRRHQQMWPPLEERF